MPTNTETLENPLRCTGCQVELPDTGWIATPTGNYCEAACRDKHAQQTQALAPRRPVQR